MTVSVSLCPLFNGWQGFNSGGIPLNAGFIYAYIAGGTTPQDTYTTSAGAVKNTNPIVLGADGRPPNEIWLIHDQSYRFDLKDALGNLLKTYDNIAAPAASNLWFTPAGASAVTRSIESKLREIESIVDLGGDPTGVADSTTAYNAARAVTPFFFQAGTYLVSSVSKIYASGVLGNMAQLFNRTITNSTYTNLYTIDDYKTWTDNSPPVAGANFISTYYAPRIVYDLTTTSGSCTGDHSVMAKNMTVNGLSYTTVNQGGGITLNASPQTVTVVNAAAISVGDTFTIDTGSNAEQVVATAPTGGTSVSGVFTKNHANGVTLGVRYKGAKVVSANVIGDQAGNTNDLFCATWNANAASGQPRQISCGSIQPGNNTGVDAYYDAFLGPYISGLEINPYGTKHSTYGINIEGASSTVKFRTGLQLASAASTALAIVNNGAGITPDGIVIASASGHGIIIGSHQSAPTNTSYALSDPTHAIFLTSIGAGASAASNILTFQERVGSADHTHGWQADGVGRLRHLYDGSESGFRIGSGGTLDKIMNTFTGGGDTVSNGYVEINVGGTVRKFMITA